jgi:excisionase family DNA binding protein
MRTATKHLGSDVGLTLRRGRPSFLAPVIDDDPAPARPRTPLNERFALSAEEAGEYVGLPGRAIREAMHRGELVGRRLGRRLLFERTAIETWVATLPSTTEG